MRVVQDRLAQSLLTLLAIRRYDRVVDSVHDIYRSVSNLLLRAYVEDYIFSSTVARINVSELERRIHILVCE